MQIEIKELGFIKNVKVDLDKNLTILCGPNNSGKTYLSYFIYGLYKYRSDIKTLNSLNKILEKGQIEFDLYELVSENDFELLKLHCINYTNQIHKVFAAENKNFSKTEINLSIKNKDYLLSRIKNRTIEAGLGIGGKSILKLIKDTNSTILNCIIIEKEKGDENDDIPQIIISSFIDNFINKIVLDLIFNNVFIAPSERVAINIFSKELSLKRTVLVDKLLELKENKKEDDPFDLISRRATRYPLPIRDMLEISEDLSNYKKNISQFNDFADEIEKDIIKGQISISSDGDVQFQPDKAKSKKFPIHLTASSVKSLSNLIIYFRHLAKPNDFIIIDEPELNLHPDNQVLIARIIAKIVNKGFKVLISTHSDYIVREINNLITLKSKPELAEELKYSNDELLNYKDVAAILFHYEKRKTENLKVNETGFEVETIDKVINELNERSQRIYF